VIQTNWVSCKAAVMINEQNLENKCQISPCQLANQCQVRMISQYVNRAIFDRALKSEIATSHTSVGVQH